MSVVPRNVEGLRVEADPNEIGPRGAIYRWRVIDEEGNEVFSNSTRVACLGFVQGVGYEREILTRENQPRRPGRPAPPLGACRDHHWIALGGNRFKETYCTREKAHMGTHTDGHVTWPR